MASAPLANPGLGSSARLCAADATQALTTAEGLSLNPTPTSLWQKAPLGYPLGPPNLP